jgi:DNA repair ATPase RecN
LVTDVGWDVLSFQVSNTENNGNSKSISDEETTSPAGALTSARPIMQVLSSGEQDRLSLALETSIIDIINEIQSDKHKEIVIDGEEVEISKKEAQGINDFKYATGASLIVYDEIDAHIGGEAAAAAARLLKRMGKFKQVRNGKNAF